MPRKKSGSLGVEGPKRVTLQDIADVVGVQRMTVSYVLNDTGSVSPAIRERVKQVARELNYVPNFAARALSRGRTGIVAILSGAVNEPYYASMIHHLEQHISGEGLHSMLMRTPDGVKDILSATGNVAVDGVIAVDMLGIVDELMVHPAIPCVAVGTFERNFVDCVLSDLSGGVREAIGIMLRAGRKRVAYVATSGFMAGEAEVRAGTYAATMRDAGIVPEIINLDCDIFSIPATMDSFRAFVKEFGCPDGLLCQNDEIAMCVFMVLQELGYWVPEDVMLVGCDGHPHMEFFKPPLSTIEQPVEEMCALAWQFLKKRIAEPGTGHQKAVVEGKLLVRESLGILDF